MPDSQYRRRLQELTDFLSMTLPVSWHDATLHAGFPSSTRTRLWGSFRSTPQGVEHPIDIPEAVTRDFAHAARAVRAELVLAGNPECKGFVFRLSKAGTSSLEVEY